MDPLTAGLEALAALRPGDIALELLRRDQLEEMDKAAKQCQADEQVFSEAVLRGDAGTCNLLIGGLRHDGPAPKLTARQLDRLAAIVPGIDGGTLVRLYCLGREGDLAVRLREIAQYKVQPKPGT